MHASVLRYFVEVARCGSVRKASETLFVSSSAVNRQILLLEEELGLELFDRLPSGMRINAAGARLLTHVQGTLHDFQTTRSELHALKGERIGHVKVAAMDSMFEEFLPSAVEEFAEQYPAVTYTITPVAPIDVPACVLSGRADAGIAIISHVPAGIRVTARAALPVGVMMAPGNPLAQKKEIRLADCVGQPHLRSQEQPHISSSVCPEFTAYWDQLEFAATCNWTPMIKRMIIAGLGIGFYSKVAFVEELSRGEVVWRPFDLPALRTLTIGIMVPGQRALPAVTSNFVDRLTRRLKQLEIAATDNDCR